MKVAVSGASGLIGSALVPALEAAGHEVVRLVRREPEATSEVAWDPDAGSIEAARLAGIDAIVNLSGENTGQRWTDSRKAEILQSRVATAGLLARTAAELDPRPATFVSAGGAGIYGDRGDEILTEESALGDGFLAEVGKAWEAAAEPARAAGLRVVSFRQGIVLSREGGALERMLTPFKLGVGGRVGSGRQWWAWVALDDLVAAYRFVLENDIAGPVNLTSPNPATNVQFVNALGKALGRPTVFPVPGFAIKTLFGQMGETMLLVGQRALPARLLDAGFQFAQPDIGIALERAVRS
ncbi:MAG: TIGR01777 family oxidoreductase [Gaiellaceae bacterium]